jgi:hypothetical protein
MIFIYIYNVMQIPNAAWSNFLMEGLGFNNFQLGILTISSAVMTWVGLVAYKSFFFKTNWRVIYVVATFLCALFSVLQILLVYGINRSIGIPDLAFSLGDNTFATFVSSVQFMPMCIMFTALCPDGSEGTAYALLTTISNLAGMYDF